MRRRFGISLLIVVGLAAEGNAWAQFDDFEATLPTAARAFCHVIRFPQGWVFPRFDKEVGQRLFFGSPSSEYEFRVEGVLSTKFLVRGFTEFVARKYYTSNQYEIDLSDATAPVLAAGPKAWDASAVVPLARNSGILPGGEPVEGKPFEFHGYQFAKSGAIWAQSYRGATLLSPDQAWLVLQSRDRISESGPLKVFFDFFNAETGQKLFTIAGTFSSLHNGAYPESGVLAKTGWLTERYFIVPLGKTIERCLVCDFGKRNGEKGTKQ
jgi:hypothetical protein